MQELKRLRKYYCHRFWTYARALREFSKKRTVTCEKAEVRVAEKIQIRNEVTEKVVSSAEKEIAYFLKRVKQPATTQVYKVLGQYGVVRDFFFNRAWIEHDWKPKFEGHKFNNLGWHFLYTTKSKDVFGIQLEDWQYVNHIGGAKALTTKIGLTHSMNNLIWQYDRDISETFPVSFDLSDTESEEFQNFRDDAYFGQVIATLKAASTSTSIENPIHVQVALKFANHRL